MSAEGAELVEILRAASLLAGKISVESVTAKSELDYVTDIDIRVDEFLTERLSTFTPGIPVFSEERAMSRPSGQFWIIDPIDGTHNMMVGLPHYGVCAALFDGERAIFAGVANVATGDVFSAEKGAGAFLNDRRLEMSSVPSTLMGWSSGATDSLMAKPGIYNELRKLGKIRNLGSQALHLCQVAEGRFGFTISAEARFWDDAAGQLIAEEAGAVYRAFAADTPSALLDLAFLKKPMRSLCAHPELFAAIEHLLEPLWSVNASLNGS